MWKCHIIDTNNENDKLNWNTFTNRKRNIHPTALLNSANFLYFVLFSYRFSNHQQALLFECFANWHCLFLTEKKYQLYGLYMVIFSLPQEKQCFFLRISFTFLGTLWPNTCENFDQARGFQIVNEDRDSLTPYARCKLSLKRLQKHTRILQILVMFIKLDGMLIMGKY